MKQTVRLRSSALAEASYDPDTRELDVEFVHGKTYTHTNVPQSVFDELTQSSSPGNFYAHNIKGQY